MALGALLLLGLGAIGCGEEKTFSGSEFVAEVNEQGVSLRLGRELRSEGGADHLYAVTLPRLRGEPAPPPDDEGSGSGPNGSLYVFGDSAGAGDQLDACRASGGLLCFRAANVVVVLDEETGIGAQRLGLAIRRLGSE